jgi:hypothetical protein
MKRITILLAVLAIAALMTQPVFAQTANQTVTLTVNSIYKIAVTGAPSLTIASSDYTAGSGSATVSDATTAKYSFTTNTATNKITAVLDSNVPTGVTLTCDMGGGAVSLSDVGATVISNLARGASSNVGITYAMTATTDADAFSGSRTVTFTFSN